MPRLAIGSDAMQNFDYALGLMLALLALIYLGYSMLRPEKF